MLGGDSSQRGGGHDLQPQSQATLPPPKRKRTSKATNSQFEQLVAKLEARPHLATRRFTGLQGRENFEAGWSEVAIDLNAIHNGAVKTPEQWITVWRDLKSRCCAKASKLRAVQSETGNRPITTPPLTELEKRVVSIVGPEYVHGTGCPDSMPEEDTVPALVDMSRVDLSCNSIYEETIIMVNSTEAEIGETQPETQPIHQPDPEPSTSQAGSRWSHNERNGAGTSVRQQTHSRRNRGLSSRRSVTEQHNSARNDFLAVAESNADAMKVLAAAATMQAEAAKIQAEAAKTQAAALMLFAEAANKICEILKEKK